MMPILPGFAACDLCGSGESVHCADCGACPGEGCAFYCSLYQRPTIPNGDPR